MKKFIDDYEDEETDDDEEKDEDEEEDDEDERSVDSHMLLCKRSVRQRRQVSYRFTEYDDLIKTAIEDDVKEENAAPGQDAVTKTYLI